jgi:hypothetical protein
VKLPQAVKEEESLLPNSPSEETEAGRAISANQAASEKRIQVIRNPALSKP